MLDECGPATATDPLAAVELDRKVRNELARFRRWRRERCLRNPIRPGCLHNRLPDRQRDTAAGAATAERAACSASVVVTDPHHDGDVVGEAGEPGVILVFRGAGLAADIWRDVAGGGCRSACNHALQDGLELVERDPISRVKLDRRSVRMLIDHLAIALDQLHRIGCRTRTLIGDRRIEPGEIDRANRLGTEHEWIIRDALLVDPGFERDVAHLLEADRRVLVDAAVEQAGGHEIARVFQSPAQGEDAHAAALIVLGRPIIFFLATADWRKRDGLVGDQRVGLQARLQGRQVGQRLDGRAGLALRLRRTVELAERIREPAGHSQNLASLVFQHDGGALHAWRHAQLGTHGRFIRPVDQLHINNVVELERALGAAQPHTQRQLAPVSQTHAQTTLAARDFSHDGRRPMHVIEHQVSVGERALPSRSVGCSALARFQTLHALCEIGLRSLEPGAAIVHLISHQTVLQCRLDSALQDRMDGRANGVGPTRCQIDISNRLGLTPQLVHEIKTRVEPGASERRHVWQRRRRLMHLVRADCPILLHAREHILEASLRTVRMAIGTEVARPLGHSGKQRAVSQGELIGGFSEIAACRHFDAPGTAAEVDRIQVQLEDFALAQHTFEARGNDHLADFALIAHVVADQEVFRHLLSNRRTALRAPRLGEVTDEGADQPVLIDSLVAVEPLVLDRNEGLLHMLGDLAQRNREPALARLVVVRVAVALIVEDDVEAAQLLILELGDVGQIGHRFVVEREHLAHVDRRLRNRFTLADLAIGNGQVIEIDALERFALRGDRLRIVHRDRDELVDVDVLQVEHLEHVIAAITQQLHGLRLIADRIELGLHVRLGGDLAKGESDGKDLN